MMKFDQAQYDDFNQVLKMTETAKYVVSTEKQQQIEQMIKQRVLSAPIQNKGFIYNLADLIQTNTINLTKNMLGDYSYKKQNQLKIKSKDKILTYLKQKYLIISSNLTQKTQPQFYQYNPNYFHRPFKTLTQMKDMVLGGKSQIEAAESGLERLERSRDFVRARFLNQAAYQFDRQRYCSIFWGVITGCFINSTIYKKGKTIRKIALTLAFAHVFGQISYYTNLDKYFDSVYVIFQEQAEKFMRENQPNDNKNKVFIKNQIQ